MYVEQISVEQEETTRKTTLTKYETAFKVSNKNMWARIMAYVLLT